MERSESKPSGQMWSTFLLDVENFEVQHVHGKGKFAFGFVEGPLVKALKSGDWYVLTISCLFIRKSKPLFLGYY